MSEYETSPSFCKYMADSQEVMDGIFIKKKLRFTQPAALNDPFDCNPILAVPSLEGEHTTFSVAGIEMPSTNFWYHIQLIESHMNEFGVLSLTKNPLSSDMWSMYASGHKGFLLEFSHDFPSYPEFQSMEGMTYEVRKVEYVDKFLINLQDCLDQSGDLSMQEFQQRLFFRKAARWGREKEYRLVRPLKDLGKLPGGIHKGIYRDLRTIYLGDLPLAAIKSVTFGAKMPAERKRWIIEKCKNSPTQFLQCFIYPLEYDEEGLSPRVELIPLDDPKMMVKILNMDPQLLLMASKELLGQKKLTFSNVSELPYYKGFEELVEMMFEGLKHRKSGK